MPFDRRRRRIRSLSPDRLAELGRKLTTLDSLDDIAEAVVDALLEVLECERIVLIVRRGGEYRVVGVHGIADGPITLGASVDLSTADSDLQAALGHPYLGVPIVAQHSVVGLIALDQPASQISKEALWVVSSIADQLSLAIFHSPENVIDDLEQELRETQEQARLRRLALDGLVHDILSPLNAIFLNVQQLHEGLLGELTDHQQEVVAAIYRSTQDATQLVTQMRELGRVDSNAEAFALAPLVFDEIVDECVAAHRPTAEERSITLEVVGATHRRVCGDRGRIDQVLNNLVRNALHYCPPEGRIELELEDQTERRRGAVKVRDTGPGVADEERDRVFQPYFRSRSASTHQKGLGLGLTIARELARRMHGDLVLLPPLEGWGAIFEFSLPFEDPADPEVC